MKRSRSLLMLLAVTLAGMCWGSTAQAFHSLRLDFSIDGTLTVDPSGIFLLEGDMFVRGGFLNGLPLGTYEDESIPTINPNCDPVAAQVFGFNAANGVAVFNIAIFGIPLGSVVTEYESCVVATNLTTLEVDVVSEGVITGGTGIFFAAKGELLSTATVSLATGQMAVDASLIFQ